MMIDSIIGWLSGAPEGSVGAPPSELRLALTALLVEAAYAHDHFDERDRVVIERLLERHFRLSPADARALLVAGRREADRSVELYGFTRIINERLSFRQRLELIEMMWEVAYADGVLDEYEDSLLRRVAGLIYVSDRDRGIARQRVLKRLGIDDNF